MRILYVSQYYPPEMGAPSARVSQLSRAWAGDGHDVTVLTGFPHHPTGIVPSEYRGRPYIRHEHDQGVHVVRSPIYATPNKGRAKRSASYLSFAATASVVGASLPRPDVVIGTSPQFLAAVAGYAIAKAHRAPFVFEVRDIWPRSVVEVGALAATSPIVRGLEQMEMYLYRHSDRIVTVTDSFVDEIAARGIGRTKFSVVKNGVDLARFTPGPADDALRQELGLSGKFVATYIGTHGMAHGLDTLLDTARLLADDDRFRLLLVGEGAEKAALVERAAREGLGNVVFLGQQPHAAIPALVRLADVTLITLRALDLFKTVIPSKMFEFMGVGRPIVMAVDGEARRILDASGAGVFVPPGSAVDVAAQIRTLADDPARRAQMGQRGRAYVEAHFSRVALARHYLEVLNDVVRGVPTAGDIPSRQPIPVTQERAA